MNLRSALPWLALCLALSGCRNDCQRLCLEMADLFESCGVDYSQDEVSACLTSYQEPDEATLATCSASLGELEELMSYKSEDGEACEELSIYDQDPTPTATPAPGAAPTR